MSLQVIDGDQYTPEVHYTAGRYTFTREKIGTRYVQLGVRILVDPNDPEDMKKVHALQDAIGSATTRSGQELLYRSVSRPIRDAAVQSTFVR